MNKKVNTRKEQPVKPIIVKPTTSKLESKIKPETKAPVKAVPFVKPIIPNKPKVSLKPVAPIKSELIVKPITIEKAVSKVVPKVAPKPLPKVDPKPVSKPASKPAPKSASKVKKPKIQADKVIKTGLRKKVIDLPPEHEKYFVYLKNPLEYRRHLLESSRKILFCLKSYQKLLLIRQKKLDEMQKLRTSIKELTYMNKKFNEKLPKYNTTFLENMQSEDKNQAPVPRVVNPRKPIVEAPREKTEIDKLEESLAKIEAKIKGLK
jgi:hypothetical protein